MDELPQIWDIRILAITLVLVSLLATVAFAGSSSGTRASYYIASTDAYISYQGSGQIAIEFSTTGMGSMSKIGATVIELYPNGTASRL